MIKSNGQNKEKSAAPKEEKYLKESFETYIVPVRSTTEEMKYEPIQESGLESI